MHFCWRNVSILSRGLLSRTGGKNRVKVSIELVSLTLLEDDPVLMISGTLNEWTNC